MTSRHAEATLLIERLYRRHLDVVRAELSRNGVRDINAAQALVLAGVGDGEVLVRDLVDRGHYLGSNMLYSLRKLVEFGYLVQTRDDHDKRACRVVLTDKARRLAPLLRALDQRHADALAARGLDDEAFATLCATLRRIERAWADILHFGADRAPGRAARRLITDELWEARDTKAAASRPTADAETD